MEARLTPPPVSLRVRTTEPLLWLRGAGHETRGSTAYYFDCRKRPDSPQVTLQLTLNGEGFYQNRRGRHVLSPGRAFFDVIPGPFDYGYNPGSPRPYELVFVSLAGPVAMRWHRRIVRQFGNVLDFGRLSPVAAQMLSVAHAREAGTLPDRYLLSARLYELLMTIHSVLKRSRVETAPRLGRALELLSERAADRSFTVETMARRLGISREHLARQFRASAGLSPSDYLTQHRLRLAAQQLRSTDDKLEAVARRCGFSGANYLCRVFRRHVGVTPAQFRTRPWMTYL